MVSSCSDCVVSGKMLGHANHNPSYDLKCIYDIRLVWTPEVSRISAMEGDCCELADRFSGILLPGSCQSHRFLPILHGTTEDDSGSDHAERLRSLFHHVSG